MPRLCWITALIRCLPLVWLYCLCQHKTKKGFASFCCCFFLSWQFLLRLTFQKYLIDFNIWMWMMFFLYEIIWHVIVFMQKLIMLLNHGSFAWQLNSNLVYFLLCCNSPVTHWCLSFSLRIAWQKSGLLLRPGHTEGTKACGQFRWITDYFTVISVHCLKQD